MTANLDARGLTCPAPVLLAKDCVDRENPPELAILVDNEAARENVTRFLTAKGYTVETLAEGGEFKLTARRKAGQTEKAPAPQPVAAAAASGKILVLIAGNRLGQGDDRLGEQLMINYVKTLKEMGNDLWQIVFVNSGVKLTVEDSPVLPELQAYERQGVIVLACGTCLAHFGLTEKKRVGATTNMLDIVTATQLADKVITFG